MASDMAEPKTKRTRIGSEQGLSVFPALQADVQQLLRLTSEIHDGVGGVGARMLSGEDLQRRLQDFVGVLHRVDRGAESLDDLKVPVDALRHLDESNLSLVVLVMRDLLRSPSGADILLTD